MHTNIYILLGLHSFNSLLITPKCLLGLGGGRRLGPPLNTPLGILAGRTRFDENEFQGNVAGAFLTEEKAYMYIPITDPTSAVGMSDFKYHQLRNVCLETDELDSRTQPTKSNTDER